MFVYRDLFGIDGPRTFLARNRINGHHAWLSWEYGGTEAYGPIAFVESTTSMDIFEEDLNRALLVSADDSREQTRRVLYRHFRDSGAEEKPDAQPYIETSNAMQLLLRRVNVVMPFWEKLEQFLENSINVCWENLKKGWNSDDQKR